MNNFLIEQEENFTDIVVGLATVPRDLRGKCWALPNRKTTTSKSEATSVAEKINKIMLANQGVFKND